MDCLKALVLGVALALGLFIFEGCASTPPEEGSPDINEAASEPTAQENAPAATDTSEADLNGDIAASQQAQPPASTTTPPPPDAGADAASLDTPPPVEQVPAPAPSVTSPPPPEVSGSSDLGLAGATVTGLDYHANINGGTIVVKTDRTVTYSTRKNSRTNQFVIELKNTTIPSRFQRPYDTKEFAGPIAAINGYQANDATRIVVQLRDSTEPGVFQRGGVISISGNGEPASTPEMAASTEGDGESAPPPQEPESNFVVSKNQVKEDGALQTSSVDDFALGNTNKFYGRPISLELKDADIRDVLAFISEESGLNIVVGEDVTGKVTLKLRRIPWDQALIILLQTKQLGYVRQGSVLRISPLVSIQKEASEAKKALDAKRDLEPLRVQVFPISYADAKQIDLQAKDFLSSRGKSRADVRTNNLVVTDLDENLVRIKALVKRLDTQTPEVLIEAKIIEARENYQRLAGINWNFAGGQINTGLTNQNGGQVTIQPQASTQAPSQSSFLNAGFTMGQLDVFGNITATLNLLETEGLAKVLSAPRIVTLDRQEADIKQTENIPIFQTTIIAGVSGSAPTVATQVSYQPLALELKVKPQITVDGSVIMDLDLLRQFAGPTASLGSSSAPPIESREAKTQILVENGDTIVIGGIYQSDVTDAETGVPWLRKIPLLGWLFKNESVTRQKNELVMFLTPRILNRDRAFNKTTDIGLMPVGVTGTPESAKPEAKAPEQPAPAPAAPNPQGVNPNGTGGAG